MNLFGDDDPDPRGPEHERTGEEPEPVVPPPKPKPAPGPAVPIVPMPMSPDANALATPRSLRSLASIDSRVFHARGDGVASAIVAYLELVSAH